MSRIGTTISFRCRPGGIPSEVFANEHRLKLNGASISLKYYGPAHTDSDISVTFGEANIVHVADTFWNGIYPFIDYSTGGSIDGMIAASDANLAATNNDTIIIPGHGKPVSNKAELQEFRDMLVGDPGQCRDAQEAGTIARRDRRGQADRRLRREVGPVRHRSRLLHQAGLRGRLIANRVVRNAVHDFDMEVQMKVAQLTNMPPAMDRRRLCSAFQEWPLPVRGRNAPGFQAPQQ